MTETPFFNTAKCLIWLVIGLLLTILVGISEPSIGLFIFASIICTAFLSLALWIPFWIFIGMVIYYIPLLLIWLISRAIHREP
ncbi:MAG: hypothetical protein ACK493_09815 [Planctomycetota bacterium]|jgi:hypothetical protein|nr:hypothetical protein [Blastopirellula sp.]